MAIKTIIVDDEPIARKGLALYASKIPFLQVDHSLSDGLEAMEVLQKADIDLVILDINMPNLNGLQLLRSLKKKPVTIIITAYPQYALEGFELDVIDYIVKPVSFERFVKAVNKANEFLNQDAISNSQEKMQYFFIKEGNRIEKINLDDIYFIESLQNYVSIHTTQKKYLSLLSLKSLEEFLSPQSFIKVQKSFIVNISKIDSIEGDEIFIQQHRIPLSKSTKESVLKVILDDRLLRRKGTG